MPKDPEETESSEESTEETEGTSEEEESAEETEEETEESDESSEESDQFYDPNKVPKELKGAFKSMQASYVKKMQKFSEDIRRGEAFIELTEIPEFKLFVKDMESGGGYGASSPYANRKSSGKSNEGDEDSDENPETKEGKLDMNRLVQQLTPVLKQLVTQAVGPLHEKESQRNLDKLRENNEDFDHYLPEITKLRKRHPTMDYQEAYDLASASKRPRVDKVALGKIKKARTEGGGAGKGGSENLTPKTVRTIREALAIAAREQGFSG